MTPAMLWLSIALRMVGSLRMQAALGDPPVSVVVEHAACRAEAAVSGDVRASLAEDLTDA